MKAAQKDLKRIIRQGKREYSLQAPGSSTAGSLSTAHFPPQLLVTSCLVLVLLIFCGCDLISPAHTRQTPGFKRHAPKGLHLYSLHIPWRTHIVSEGQCNAQRLVLVTPGTQNTSVWFDSLSTLGLTIAGR